MPSRSKPPRLTLFFGQHNQNFELFLKWLRVFEHKGIGYMTLEPQGWLVAAEGLCSAMPLSDSFRNHCGTAIEAFVPIRGRATLENPAGIYCLSEISRTRANEAKRANAENGSIILCRADGQVVVRNTKFQPLTSEFLRADPHLPVSELKPTAPLKRSLQLAVKIEKQIRPNPQSVEAKSRRLKERYEVGLQQLGCEQRLEEYEPHILTVVPHARISGMTHLLRTLPMEVIESFSYFAGENGGQRLHFIYPALGSEILDFPAMSGAIKLQCPSAWGRAGLNLFLPPDLRLNPVFQFRDAAAIRRALLNERAANGSGNVFLAFIDQGQGLQGFAVPSDAFVNLAEAIGYINGMKLTDFGAKLTAPAVGEFWSALEREIEETANASDKRQSELCEAADQFYKAASERIKAAIKDFDQLAARVEDIERENRRKLERIQSFDRRINNLIVKRNIAEFKKFTDELDSLHEDMNEFFP